MKPIKINNMRVRVNIQTDIAWLKSKIKAEIADAHTLIKEGAGDSADDDYFLGFIGGLRTALALIDLAPTIK